MAELEPRDYPPCVDNIVITCMDYRYQERIDEILKEKHGVNLLGTADRLSIGGSSKGVVDGSLIPSIKIGYDKHSVKNVYIFDHTDCGGFGTIKAYDNDEAKEAMAHFESQDKAQEAIHKIMPELVVVSYVIGLDGDPLER